MIQLMLVYEIIASLLVIVTIMAMFGSVFVGASFFHTFFMSAFAVFMLGGAFLTIYGSVILLLEKFFERKSQ